MPGAHQPFLSLCSSVAHGSEKIRWKKAYQSR